MLRYAFNLEGDGFTVLHTNRWQLAAIRWHWVESRHWLSSWWKGVNGTVGTHVDEDATVVRVAAETWRMTPTCFGKWHSTKEPTRYLIIAQVHAGITVTTPVILSTLCGSVLLHLFPVSPRRTKLNIGFGKAEFCDCNKHETGLVELNVTTGKPAHHLFCLFLKNVFNPLIR